ncbi:hypothetical protein ACHAO1_005558 [Botrytis cinerea]
MEFRKLKEFWLRRTCSGPNWGRADGYEFAPTVGLVNRSDQESSSTYAHQPMANKDAYCTEQGDLQGVQFSKDLVLTNTYTRFLECGILSDGRVDPDWGKEWLVSIGAIARASDTEVYNKQLIKSVKHLDIRLIWPHSDVLFFYTHNPVYCGMIGLRLLTSYDEARLAHCDFHLVIIFMAHLYQECVRTSFFQKVWPAMETMIQLHRKDIFDGNVPKSADEAYEKFSKQFFLSKVSSQEYARAKPPGEMTMPELSRKAFSQAIRPFLEHQATFNEATNNLQNLVQNLPSAAMMKDNNRRVKRQLTSLQFLHVLEGFLPEEISKLQFDYIALTLACYPLLEKIRLAIDPTGKQNPKRTLPGGREPAFLFMTLDIISKGRTGGENPLLRIVAGVLEKFLEDEEILKT